VPNPFALDPNMPQSMQSAVLGALTTEQDPAKLQAFAQEIQGQFPIAAGLLMAKANALRLQPGPSPVVPTPPSLQALTAVVTTHDPAPLGDLRVHDRPNGAQIGAIDKNGTVTVLQWNADGGNQWARVAWAGGRRPAVTGFVSRAYLQATPSVPVLARRGASNGIASHA
jgi:hypothetical protein